MIFELNLLVVRVVTSVTLSLVTHVVTSMIFKLVYRKRTTSELVKSTILCLDVVAFAVGEGFRLWINLTADNHRIGRFLCKELITSMCMAPIYIFVIKVLRIQLSFSESYRQTNLWRLFIWTASLARGMLIIVSLNTWERYKITIGADLGMNVLQIKEAIFMPFWYALYLNSFASIMPMLRTSFIQHGVLYGYHTWVIYARTGLCCWLPFVGQYYRAWVEISRELASQHLIYLLHANEDYHGTL